MLRLLKILKSMLILSLLLFTMQIMAENKNIEKQDVENKADFVSLPQFSIAIKMDDALKDFLYKNYETIIVLADFTGEPVKVIPKKYRKRVFLGEFNLTSHRVELLQQATHKNLNNHCNYCKQRNAIALSKQSAEHNQVNNQVNDIDSQGLTATFDAIRIPQEYYDLIKEHNVKVLINIFTGRHFAQNNLLDCEVLYEDLNKIADKTIPLNCKKLDIPYSPVSS